MWSVIQAYITLLEVATLPVINLLMREKVMNSVLDYIGQKNLTYLSDSDLKMISKSKIYCEPFSGSFNLGIQLIGTKILRLDNQRIVLNDLDDNIINFWKQLSIDYGELIYNVQRAITRELDIGNTKNDSELAAVEFSRRLKSNKKYNFNIDNYICEFCILSEYMKNIELSNKNYVDIIRELDSESTFFFIDPPYIDIRHIRKYYRCNPDRFNHQELANILSEIKSKFILTYNENEIIREYYKKYNIREYRKIVHGREYTELIVSNF